jgi:hypothetical protein
MAIVGLAFTAISPTMARAKARATTLPVWASEDDFGSFAAKEDDAMAEQTRARSSRIPLGWPWPWLRKHSALSQAEFTFTLLTPGSAP